MDEESFAIVVVKLPIEELSDADAFRYELLSSVTTAAAEEELFEIVVDSVPIDELSEDDAPM